MSVFSLRGLFLRFKWRISATLSLVLLESVLDILYPLCIGLAINGLLDGNPEGLMWLAGLGLMSALTGSLRRFCDTRIYARIYRTIAPEMVDRERGRQNNVSSISARAGLLTEFVEFMENSLPQLIAVLVSLVGVLIIISALNTEVFFACLAVLGVAALTYTLTGRLNFRLNAGFNNELERQVSALGNGNSARVQGHFRRLMRWNIRLSDLETANFLVIWLAIVALIVFAPMSAIDSGVTNYGLVFSLLMYVFSYIESVANLPLFVQQLIRLNEISIRLNGIVRDTPPMTGSPGSEPAEKLP